MTRTRTALPEHGGAPGTFLPGAPPCGAAQR
ncbi:hypothetical protein SFR_5987 [Streptomyces sp. FR-008]|nr:hypothetical protein SFR_5987 [Streptomyces sp. FR-008]